MSTNVDYIRSEEWSQMVNEEENSLPENDDEVELEQKHSRNNGAQLKHEKEQLEGELAKLVLITAHNKNALQEMLMHTQDADDEIKLCLALLRADLKGRRSEPTSRGEMLNWGVMEQRIFATLTRLEECQDSAKLKLDYQLMVKNLKEKFTTMSQRKRSQKRRSVRCFHRGKRGHIRRECPHQMNTQKGMQTEMSDEKTVSGQEYNEARMAEEEKQRPEEPESSGEAEKGAMIALEQSLQELAH